MELPDEVREPFVNVSFQTAALHERWNMYRQLYADTDGALELMNASASAFFGNLQRLWLDYTVIEICRLTDPAETGPKTNRKQNLTLEKITFLLREHGLDRLVPEDGLSKVDKACRPLRQHRNRWAAHLDFAENTDPNHRALEGTARAQIEAALNAIREFLNEVHFASSGEHWAYEYGVPIGDGHDLLECLCRAEAFRELERTNWRVRLHRRSVGDRSISEGLYPITELRCSPDGVGDEPSHDA
ncbi:hypothetical protein [Alienimonas sp. DA493]|uniref:AbiU2 domain-containing protein n=1 Tax=Alienimonas sp. DA493 TaxID=3373605 RepID=UPI003754E943